jgi:hypothetical protein
MLLHWNPALPVKIEGMFDRSGLPDPLVMNHCFIVAGDKVAMLTCQLVVGNGRTVE